MSNELKSWSDSRQYCRDHEADLIMINTEEKQVSLFEFLLINESNYAFSCFCSPTEVHIFISQ